MNVVDSSAWLEYFADGANAAYFAAPIEDTARLLVPSLCLYEVFRRVLQQRSESDALQAIAMMRQGTLVELDGTLAIEAARLGAMSKLPMADSVILATARMHKATLWTQDADFAGMERVNYRERRG
jgi:predicted nucleic acid-binding protein